MCNVPHTHIPETSYTDVLSGLRVEGQQVYPPGAHSPLSSSCGCRGLTCESVLRPRQRLRAANRTYQADTRATQPPRESGILHGAFRRASSAFREATMKTLGGPIALAVSLFLLLGASMAQSTATET